MKSFALRFSLAATLVAGSFAQAVIVVDDNGGPGVQFTNLGAAINVAGPLDRIEVRAGSYPDVTITSPMTIMGQPGAFVSKIVVVGMDDKAPLVLADIAGELVVSDCDGPVIVDNERDLTSTSISVVRSANVWLQAVRTLAFSTTSLVITDSTVFANESSFSGIPFANIGADGSDAAVVSGASRVVFANCSLRGGSGGCGNLVESAGFSGHALEVSGDADVTLLQTELVGGVTDFFFGGGCLDFGPSGDDLRLLGNNRVLSTQVYPSQFVSTAADFSVDADFPTVTRTGVSQVGTTLRFSTESNAGSSARLWLGRFPVLRDYTGVRVQAGFVLRAGFSLGALPMDGIRDFDFTIPQLPRGTIFFAQASRTLVGGATELSNPLPIVVR